ncbi:MAG: hypothetical protein ACC628_23660, partial [Pirellulaceae bacterium]
MNLGGRIQAGPFASSTHFTRHFEYLVHYHAERNHQGLNNKIIDPDRHVGRGEGEVMCQERLGGLLRHYDCDAASRAGHLTSNATTRGLPRANRHTWLASASLCHNIGAPARRPDRDPELRHI